MYLPEKSRRSRKAETRSKSTYSQVHEALLRMFKNEKSINKVFIQQHDLKFSTSKADYPPHFP